MIMAQLTMAEDDVITNKNVETRAVENETTTINCNNGTYIMRKTRYSPL